MSSSASPLTYPVTKRSDAVDEYFGTRVPDPYQWLEDPDAAETQAWVTAQNAVTQTFLAQCPAKTPLEEKLKALYNYPRQGCPFRRGPSRVFFFHNSGLQNQSVLYKQRDMDADPEVLLDPNTLAEDGTAALGAYGISEDGQLLAYGVSRSGSDWSTISVMRVDDNSALADQVEWVKFSGVSWTHDHKGFFYSRYPQPAAFKEQADENIDNLKRGTETAAVKNHMVYYHRIGTPQSDDVLVHACPDNPDWTLSAEVSEDGLFLLLTMSDGCDTKNRVYITALNADFSFSSACVEPAKLVKLIDRFEAEFGYVNNEGTRFFFRTNHTADRYRLIALDIAAGAAVGLAPDQWSTIIPQHSKDVLETVAVVRGGANFITIVSRDVKEVLSLYSSSGDLLVAELPLPDVGAVSGLTARKQDSSFFYAFSSFLYPGTIYSCDLSEPDASKQSRVFKEITLPGFDASLFTTKQVFYDSKDGTKIPMFIVHRKDLVKDGSSPCWQYGYGGFNISLPPSFSVARVLFMQAFNGVFAMPNIRGGGEYGEQWYKAGVLLKKRTCFEDFIAASEYLIREKYTSAGKLAINGGSNGGLLVCACLNERPDLFGCVVGQVGVLDMLKYHTFTIGHAWASDYGRSDHSKEMFEYLLGYSPVHTVRADGTPYPALLLTTADHDDRVVPLHSYKYINEVQHALGKNPRQTAPLLIRIEEKAGHGAGMPLVKKIVEQADVIAFMAKTLGVEGKF